MEQFKLKTQVVGAMLQRIPFIQDAQVELNMQRASLGVGKITHLLRVAGSELVEPDGALQKFDAIQKEGLQRLLPALSVHGVDQPFRPYSLGGVGLTLAEDIASAAQLASLTGAKPIIESLATESERVGLFAKADLMRVFEQKRNTCRAKLLKQDEQADKEQIDDLISAADMRAQEEWAAVCTGRPSLHAPLPQVRQRVTQDVSAERHIEASNQLESGHVRSDPDELGGHINSLRLSVPHLQRELSLLVHVQRVNELLDTLGEEHDRSERRLAEIIDKGVDHGWI